MTRRQTIIAGIVCWSLLIAAIVLWTSQGFGWITLVAGAGTVFVFGFWHLWQYVVKRI